MSHKRYYWLKLKDDFFEDDTIAWLEEQENGKDYVLFYLKLALKSLREDGSLIRYVGEMLMPYDVKALAKLTNTPVDTVAVAMKVFEEIGLISKLETGEIYMNQINEMIGSETDSAIRMRKLRLKNQVNSGLIENSSHCDRDVQKCDTEIDIELEKELEKDNVELHSPSYPFKEIIDYLNLKADTRYRSTSKKTQSLIRARINEGFTLEDFKTVIDKKTTEWKSDKKMSAYLRPETLFGTKFEGYLNQKGVNINEESTINDEEYGLVL